MGWDAHACDADGEWLDFSTEIKTCPCCNQEIHGRLRLDDPTYRHAYELAADIVRDLTEGSCDGCLPHGGLDVSTSGQALEDATGLSVRTPAGWQASEVRQVAGHAYQPNRWPDDVYGHSARLFLATTAMLNLGVAFTW